MFSPPSSAVGHKRLNALLQRDPENSHHIQKLMNQQREANGLLSCFASLCRRSALQEYKANIYGAIVNQGLYQEKFTFAEGKDARDLVNLLDAWSALFNSKDPTLHGPALPPEGIKIFLAQNTEKDRLNPECLVTLQSRLTQILRIREEAQGAPRSKTQEEADTLVWGRLINDLAAIVIHRQDQNGRWFPQSQTSTLRKLKAHILKQPRLIALPAPVPVTSWQELKKAIRANKMIRTVDCPLLQRIDHNGKQEVRLIIPKRIQLSSFEMGKIAEHFSSCVTHLDVSHQQESSYEFWKHLSSFYKVDKLILKRSNIPPFMLAYLIAKLCPWAGGQLRHLDVKHCSQITTSYEGLDFDSFEGTFGKQFSLGLREEGLYSPSILSGSHAFSLSRGAEESLEFDSVKEPGAGLQRLVLSGVPLDQEMEDGKIIGYHIFSDLAEDHSGLKKLHLGRTFQDAASRTGKKKEKINKALAQLNFLQLHSLSLRHNEGLTSEALQVLGKGVFRNLRHLSLAYNSWIRSSDIYENILSLGKLTYLNLSGLSCVTPRLLEEILSRCKNITELKINDCKNINPEKDLDPLYEMRKGKTPIRFIYSGGNQDEERGNFMNDPQHAQRPQDLQALVQRNRRRASDVEERKSEGGYAKNSKRYLTGSAHNLSEKETLQSTTENI